MILKPEEIRRSLAGSWELFKGRPEGMHAFDVSITGFWRSFGVILLLALPYAVTVLAEKKIVDVEGPIPLDDFSQRTFVFAKAIGFALDWACFPILLALLAGPLGISARYVPYIVARNWTSAIAILPYMVPALLYITGLIEAGAAAFLTLFAIGFVLRYQYIVARVALDATIGMAIALVALDTVLSFVIGAAVNRAIGL